FSRLAGLGDVAKGFHVVISNQAPASERPRLDFDAVNQAVARADQSYNELHNAQRLVLEERRLSKCLQAPEMYDADRRLRVSIKATWRHRNSLKASSNYARWRRSRPRPFAITSLFARASLVRQETARTFWKHSRTN